MCACDNNNSVWRKKNIVLSTSGQCKGNLNGETVCLIKSIKSKQRKSEEEEEEGVGGGGGGEGKNWTVVLLTSALIAFVTSLVHRYVHVHTYSSAYKNKPSKSIVYG